MSLRPGAKQKQGIRRKKSIYLNQTNHVQNNMKQPNTQCHGN